MVDVRQTVPFTLEEVQGRYSYNAETGIVTMKNYKYARHMEGHTLSPTSGTTINYYPIKTTQIAWMLYYGVWPNFIIDHKDRDPSNNKIDNLRRATSQENSRNTMRPNMWGKGVVFCGDGKRLKRWAAFIRNEEGRKVNLGRFHTPAEAAAAYKEAARRFHGEFAATELNDYCPPNPLDQRGDI